jgi:hypothetical protein
MIVGSDINSRERSRSSDLGLGRTQANTGIYSHKNRNNRVFYSITLYFLGI